MRVSPLALVGALSLVALASDFISIEQNLSDWLTVWKSVTRKFWDFLLGWLWNFFGLPFPYLVKDYFTAGAIFSSAALRADIYLLKANSKSVKNQTARRRFLVRWVSDFITWPIGFLKIVVFGAITMVALAVMRRLMQKRAHVDQGGSFGHANSELVSAAMVIDGSMRVFGDSLIWSAIIIVTSYVLIISGAESEPPKIELLWV